MNEYPRACIRGIQKGSSIRSNNKASLKLFLPDDRTKKYRNDNGIETSINWEDNETVLDFTLNYKDDNNRLVFPNGAVRLSRDRIDSVITNTNVSNPVSYERDKLEDNPYHGNIVFRDGLAQHDINLICGTFALYCSKVHTRQSNS